MSTGSGVLFGVAFLLMIIGLLTVVLGIFIWKKKLVSLVSMHSEVKEKDIEAFTKVVGQSTIGFGIAIIFMGLFFVINRILLGFIIFAICMIVSLVIYFIAQNKYNNRFDVSVEKKGDFQNNNSKKIAIIAVAVTAVTLITILTQFFSWSKPTVYSINGSTFKISTSFGESINIADIKSIQLKNDLPGNISKTYGLNMGSILKGQFSSNIGKVTLYLDNSISPFIYISTDSGLIIINDESKIKTQALYDVLNSKIMK